MVQTKFPPDYTKELVNKLKKQVFTFDHLDGMYSFCFSEGEIHHPAVWSDVQVVA